MPHAFFSINVLIIKKHQFQELVLLLEGYRRTGDGLLVTSLLSSQTSRSYHGTWHMDIPSGAFATQNLTLEPHLNWYLPISHLHKSRGLSGQQSSLMLLKAVSTGLCKSPVLY